MNKPIKEIKDNYVLYSDLIYKGKFLSAPELMVYSTKKSRADFVLDEFSVTHSVIPQALTLMVEVRVNNAKSFKFQLKFLDLCHVPLFRYDSDGAAHHNRDYKTGIVLQKVNTPHFNYFADDGRSRAYVTTFITDPRNAYKYEDINECFSHFCEEAYIETEGKTKIILNKPGTFEFSPIETADPLTSVIYFPD